MVGVFTLTINSCTQSEIDEYISINTKHNEPTFYASFSEESSRTLLNEQMKNIWCADDRISIFMGNTYNHQYRFDGKTGDISGSFSKVDDPFISGEKLSANYAIYPYDEETSIDSDGVIYVTLPTVQNFQEGSFGINANTMVAVTESSSDRFLAFQNLCGYVRVSFYGEDITLKEITLSGNDNEVLAGPVQVISTYNQEPIMSFYGATEKHITIDCGDGVKIGTTEYDATSFVFVVPPQILKKGFTIAATDINDKVYAKQSSKSQTIKRNTILSMPTLELTDGTPTLEIPDEVLTIHNAEKGMLLVELMEYDYDDIVSMKVTGTMNDEDFLWIYYEMPALRYLDISELDITTLPNKSFYYSTNVETIILPKTLQTIPDEVFSGSVVKEVYLNEGLQAIGTSAFAYCDSLKSIHFPKSLLTIGAKSFYGCEALEEVTFASGCKLSNLNVKTFSYSSITSIQIPANVEYLEIGDNSPFNYCKNLKTVTFEDNSKLTVIGDSFDFTKLETIEIPNSVETIDVNAFSGLPLQNVFFEQNSSLKTIGAGAFANTALQEIQIPASVQLLYYQAFYSCDSLKSVVFENGSNLTDIGIGIEVGRGVFEECGALKSVIIPSSVTTIHAKAFKSCSTLESVEFADNSQCQVIGGGWNYESSNGAFAYCTSLMSITIPKSVTTIGIGAFYSSGLTSVTFEDNSKLEELQGYVEYIDKYDEPGSFPGPVIGAFAYTKLSSIELPVGLKIIGDGVFAGCASLKNVNFGENNQLTSIGKKAFANCNLSSIKIPRNVQTIEDSAFSTNQNLKIINFVEGSQLKVIEHCAFMDCGSLNYFYAQNVTCLEELGINVFKGCDDMRLFKLGTINCPTADHWSFGQIGTYSVLKVPTESVESYKKAEGWKRFVNISGLDE